MIRDFLDYLALRRISLFKNIYGRVGRRSGAFVR
jgi:hypothetical protein